MYHSRNLAIPSKGYPANAKLRIGILWLIFKEAEERVEKEIELLHLYLKYPGPEVMSKFVYHNKQAQCKNNLQNLH